MIWLKEFNEWLRYDPGTKSMYCEPCRGTKQATSWAQGIQDNFRRDIVTDHIKPGAKQLSRHQRALEILKTRKRSSSQAMLDLFEPELKVDSSDLMVALKSMYHVIHDNNEAFTKYESELDFLSDFKVCSTKEQKPGNANLRGQNIKADIIKVLGDSVFEDIKAEIQQSPCISVLIDETQDIRITEQLIIYVKYIMMPDVETKSRCQIRTRFVGIVEVSVW